MARTEHVGIWLPVYIGDFRRDTHGRGLVFKAMYLNLLMTMWENDGQIEDDECYLAEAAGATKAQWLQHRQALANLFYPGEGYWMHNGIRERLAKARKVSEARKVVSKLGVEARQARSSTGKAMASIVSEPAAPYRVVRIASAGVAKMKP